MSGLEVDRLAICPDGDFNGDNKAVPPTDCCAVSTFPPAKNSRALKFCHIFPDTSCCLPAHDAEIEEYYYTLLDAGDLCAKEPSQAKDALRSIFCLGCDPNSGRSFSKSDPDNDYDMITVCSGLAEQVAPYHFDDCGMVLVEERGCAGGPECGDDTIIPSRQWFSCETGQVSLANLNLQMNFGFGLGAMNYETVELPEDDGCWGVSDTTLDAAGIAIDGVDGAMSLSTAGVAGCALEIDAENSPQNDFSCTPSYKFLNDDSGGKPPYFEGDYMVVIEDCSIEGQCLDTEPTSFCFTGGASQVNTSGMAMMLLPLVVTALSTLRH